MEKNKRDLNIQKIKSKFIKIAGTLFWVAVIILLCGTIIIGGTSLYCQKNPSFDVYSMCYDANLKCEYECNQHGQNFTGKWTKNNMCDCGEGEVGVCSGVYFPYKPVMNNE